MKTKIRIIWILTILFLWAGTGEAGTLDPVKPSKKDKCPVCGMFVYKYPDWIAEIIFKDGSTVFFDGAKDMFKYYFDIQKYSPEKNKRDIAAMYVTEYYAMKIIDARKAYFVLGSDVYGPMGHELIPLASDEDARVFMKDHKGKRLLRFREITPTAIPRGD